MSYVEIKNLKKRFNGVHAVDDLSFAIKKGEITGIIGPNGSGKTTLINLLTGMVSIDSGLVVLNENDKIEKIQPHELLFYGVTRTFQEVRLFNQMTVLDNILVVLSERNVFSALFEKHGAHHLNKARSILEKVGLWEKKNELAVNLSYGQRKLLEIARALSISNVDLFLFDEPFAGLFPHIIKTVVDILQELKHENKAVVLIEHNMSLIRDLCDHVVVLDSGKLLAEGKAESVLEQRSVIEAYLGD